MLKIIRSYILTAHRRARPGDTPNTPSKPLATSCVRRLCDERALHIRETGVPGIRSASIDAAEDRNDTW
jgi:hypothetical protein